MPMTHAWLDDSLLTLVVLVAAHCCALTHTASAKINISYSILFNLTTSYSSYFGGKKGISRNKTSLFLLIVILLLVVLMTLVDLL